MLTTVEIIKNKKWPAFRRIQFQYVSINHHHCVLIDLNHIRLAIAAIREPI